MEHVPPGGSCERGEVSTLGSPIIAGTVAGQSGSLGALEPWRRTQLLVSGGSVGEGPAQAVVVAARPRSLRCSSVGVGEG